jgi:hypothetical protein
VGHEKSKLLFDEMHAWLLREREMLSCSAEVFKPINYMLKRWSDFARFLDDGRICMSNNAAERSLRGLALGRRNWIFAGLQRGADRAAVMLTMITTCRLNESIPRRGSPTSSTASPIFPPRVCANSCPESGRACAKWPSPLNRKPPDLRQTST